MYQLISVSPRFSDRLRSSSFMLSSSWIFGLVSGLYAASSVSASVIELLQFSLRTPLLLDKLIISQTIPLLLTCVVCWMSKPLLILPISFLKAFSFSLCTAGVIAAHGEAGWLVRWLILFSDIIAVVFLIWFWVRRLNNRGEPFFGDFFICFAFVTMTCFFHYYTVCFISVC